ncbi:MAG TPA: hypothetical protein VH008_24185 [Pseudonocardia sp.]|nr:hypothetical protein [Pseudonocardia sp.]
MDRPELTELYRIPTSGARAIEPFELGGAAYLAIPQLATDVPGAPAHMNGGDSDTDLLVLRATGEGYTEFQRLAVPGGEDAEFFRIGEHSFLAAAGIRSGAGPYDFHTRPEVFRWDGARFAPFQSFPGFAAKQWTHIPVGDRHFLGLAQGVALPGTEADNLPSRLYEWDGTRFEPFQDIASRWAYNWHPCTVGGQRYLAHADNVVPSLLYRWDGTRFVEHQELADRHGRAFADFEVDGEHYLLVGRLQSDSALLRWDGERFVPHQQLPGPGGREFAVLRGEHGLYVVRVNFVLGTPDKPTTALTSAIYRWDGSALRTVVEFPTTGGTDAAVFHDAGGTLVGVTNSLSADARFAADTVIYRFTG